MNRKDPCIIYYHGNDWDGVAARQRYLMEAMSEYLPVIYLDGTPERRGRVTYSTPSERVTVVKGLVSLLIALERRGLGRVAELVARWHLRWARERHGSIVFWNAENWARPYRFIPHDVLVFDSIDPCFSTNLSVRAEHEKRDREVIGVADIVFASADALAEQCRQDHPNVHVVNNASEPREYTSDLLTSAEKPEWWPADEVPVAAYLGSLDWRFDFDLVEAVCRLAPDISFVLAGSIVGDVTGRVTQLVELPNVICPGRVSVDAGRYLLSHCDVGLIPFTPGPMNDAINPVKMYAYALLGKPIVGTAIRELEIQPKIVTAARTAVEFVAAIRRGIRLSNDFKIEATLRAFATENCWRARGRVAWAAIQPFLQQGAAVTQLGRSTPVHDVAEVLG